MRGSLPQITQIYTDIGCRKKDTNHTNAAQEKSVTIHGISGKTFSQEKSVRICEIRGTTSLKQHAEESPTDYADLHGYWVRRRRTRITRMQHKKISVTIRDICGKTFSRNICDNPWNLWDNITQAACGGVSHRLRRFTRILGTEKKDTNHTDVAQEISVTIRGICGKTFLSRKICDNP